MGCGNEKGIVLLQSLGGVEGELAKTRSFNAIIPRLKTMHDTAKVKAQLAKFRERAWKRNILKDDDGWLESASARSFCQGEGPMQIEKLEERNEELEETLRARLFSNQSLDSVTLKDMEDGHTLSTLYERLQQCINMTLELSGSIALWSVGDEYF